MASITEQARDGEGPIFQCSGDWTIASLARLEKEINQFKFPPQASVVIDCHSIDRMDTNGAWMLNRFFVKAKKHYQKVELKSLAEKHQTLFRLITEVDVVIDREGRRKKPFLYHLGKATVEKFQQLLAFLNFLGEMVVDSVSKIPARKHMQWNSVLYNMEEHGYRAMPIIALLSFLVGLVLAYQMGLQLKEYGANLFIVNILGLTILREFAPFFTAIILAGRTASSYTAQLGMMKINEEIDALKTLGMSPFRRLVIPKIIALILVMPLLSVWSAIFGVIGGMVMAKTMLDINFYDFLFRFEQVTSLKTYLIGLSKTPVFAIIIALVGCFQGWRSGFSAESVGRQTTKSVVQALFLIIVADALFSIYFSWTDL